MNNNAIVERVIELLRGHQNEARGVSMRGSISQEPIGQIFSRYLPISSIGPALI